MPEYYLYWEGSGMYFMVVGKVRIKIALFAAFVSFGIMMYLAAVAIVNSNFCCSITIADSFSFSYPYAFHIDRMYSHSSNIGIIKTNSPAVVPVVNDLSDLKESVPGIEFKYPPTFILDEKDISGSEILYHIDFRDSQGDARGFVQVWQLSVPVEEFLEQSKQISQLNYIGFDERTYDAGNRKWILWDYSIIGGNGVIFKGMEAFFGENKKMYRVSYFVPEKDWGTNHLEVFQKMLKSFEIE
jgi:hypothetical protein